jgi:N-acetyl-gamma-glutamyl-phosphate reductase common form
VNETWPEIPVLVLGGSGYVAGELLRLLAGHPSFRVGAILSESQAGAAVEAAFPHLDGSFAGLRFSSREELPAFVAGQPRLAIFSAAPPDASAPLVDEMLTLAESAGARATVVDLSADFRFSDPAVYEAVYRHPHGAPARLAEFLCALPEHADADGVRHVGHPGCFTTAVTLAAVPLVGQGWIEPDIHVSAITGSTGAGRTPTATTHHPERRSNVFGYGPLGHRHQPEMRRLVERAAGAPARIHFAPQSGPHARGIYATLQARLARPAESEELRAALTAFYAGAPFVEVVAEPPRLQDVAGTNRCRISVASADGAVVVFSALDNLVKGAAGGGIQWMNRLWGLDETSGLRIPGLGWL